MAFAGHATVRPQHRCGFVFSAPPIFLIAAFPRTQPQHFHAVLAPPPLGVCPVGFCIAVCGGLADLPRGAHDRPADGSATGRSHRATAGPGPAQFGGKVRTPALSGGCRAHAVGPAADTRKPRIGRPGQPLPRFCQSPDRRCRGLSDRPPRPDAGCQQLGKRHQLCGAKLPLPTLFPGGDSGAHQHVLWDRRHHGHTRRLHCRSVVPGPAHCRGGGRQDRSHGV